MRKIKLLLLLWCVIVGAVYAQEVEPQRPNGEPMITVSPQVITAYPLDVLDFTALAGNFPPLWVVSNKAVASSYRLPINNAIFDAYRLALQLRSGRGSIEWTLDSKCLPGASESLSFLIGVNSTGSNILELRFSATQMRVFDSTGAVQTNTLAVASGSRIKLEMDGPVLRGYVDDVLYYTKTYGSTSPYPVRALAYNLAAWATSPTTYELPAPVLTGDWQTSDDYVSWNVPATLGSYTTKNSTRTARVTLGTTPGQYTLTGIIGSGGLVDCTLTSTGSDTVYLGLVLAVNDTVRFGKGVAGVLPGGLAADTTYYIKSNPSSQNFTLSLTQGGSTVDITSAGTNPVWVARTGEIALQSGTATVIVPAFDVLGIPPNGNLDLEPGEVRTFKTTYDKAQNFNSGSYITRTVVTGGGGSFDSNTGAYTAPSTAGTYTLRHASNGQQRDFTVTIPLTFTPASEFVYPGEARTNTTTMSGTLTWTATGGVSLSGSGQTRTWTAPSNIGQVVRIQVTNGTDTLYADYTVKDVLPVTLQASMEWEAGPDTLIAYPDGGENPWYRTKTVTGFTPLDFGEIKVTCPTLSDYNALEAFHDKYMRNGDSFFIVEHQRSNRRTAVRFDSRLKARTVIAGASYIEVTFRLRNA